MICAGPFAAALVGVPLLAAALDVAGPGEVALVELAEGVELDPHAATTAATTALITIDRAFTLVVRVSTMIYAFH